MRTITNFEMAVCNVAAQLLPIAKSLSLNTPDQIIVQSVAELALQQVEEILKQIEDKDTGVFRT